MSISSDIRDQAYQFFIEEAPELLQMMEDGLLSLKTERSKAKVHDIMRAAHSLKGGSASVELQAIKTIAHRLEDIFKAFYDDKVELDTELESLLLAGYDCLKDPLMEQIETGSYDDAAALAKAEPLFAQIEALLGDALLSAEDYIPSSADLGIDIVTSIFEIDVAQGLERLKKVITHPQGNEVAGELRAQAEVFAGFAELLSLPGFGEIAQLAIQALEASPHQAIEITQIALADFEQARDLVLAGDRTQGGAPSTALTALASERAPQAPVSGSSNHASQQPTPETKPVEPTLDVPSLDDVFGDLIPSLEPEAATPELTPMPDVMPALDNLLGDITELPDLGVPTADTNEAHHHNATVPLDVCEDLADIPDPVPNQDLQQAVQSIEQLFSDLPTIESPDEAAKAIPSAMASETFSPPTKTTSQKGETTQPPERKRSNSAVVGSNLAVRINLNRLEKMNNLVGELVINRNSLALQNDQLQSGLKELLNRFSNFQGTTSRLREIYDAMSISPEHYGAQLMGPERDAESEFDALEMDHYGKMHSLLQGIFEEMIQLEESVEDITLYVRRSNQIFEQQRQMLTNLRDELMWARMFPLGDILNRFPRVLRDLSTKHEKPVRLKFSGKGVLVDKAMLEKLYDPLLHLLRNAFDHGIESKASRQARGKSEEGTIEIRAYHQGNQTFIEIVDDGEGINAKKIAQKAIALGILSEDQLSLMTPEQIANLIFEPGFSTADQVSDLSGRGVGLDVVRTQLQELKGSVTVSSKRGQGTTFTLQLPLTLTISKLLVCLAGSTAFALPSDSIEEIVIPQANQVQVSGSHRFFSWRNQIVPVHHLSSLLDYNCYIPEMLPGKSLSTVASPEDWALPLLLMRLGHQWFALEVNRLITEQELVIKPFGAAMMAPPYTYGCTILGDGRLIPVVNCAALLTQTLDEGPSSSDGIPVLSPPVNTPPTIQAKNILVVDDSAALRRTLALTLQKSGYRVLQAKDGKEALEQLRQSANVQLIICDIEMPNMNGFEFLSQRRQEPNLADIPVAMLTSRSSEKHRKLATHLGASAYFSKPYIEQQFLGAIKTLLDRQSLESLAALSNPH